MALKAVSGLGDPLLGPLRSGLQHEGVDARLRAGKGQSIPETSVGLQGQSGHERPDDGWARQAKVEFRVGRQWASGPGQDWTKSIGSRSKKSGQGTVQIDGPKRDSTLPEQSEALGRVSQEGLSGWEKSAWAHKAIAAFEESMRFMGGLFTKPFAS